MQRKLNTKFLVIGTVIVVGGLVGAVVVGPYIFRGTAQKHASMAKLYVDQHRYRDAIDEYKLAISLDPRDPEMLLNLADATKKLSRTDSTMLGKEQSALNRALEVDPSYTPAMRELLASYQNDAQVWPSPQYLARVRDICDRIIAIDPNDIHAKATLHMAWLQSWLVGAETSVQQVDQSLAELKLIEGKLAATTGDVKDNDDRLNVPVLCSRAMLKKAEERISQDRRGEADLLVGDVEAMMQQCIASDPENPRTHLRNAQVMLDVANLYRNNPDKNKTYRAMAAASVTRAQELVKKDETAFGEVTLMAGSLAQMNLKPDEAEKLYRSVLEKHPEDRRARLALAQVMVTDPAKRKDAIILLEEEPSEDNTDIRQRVQLQLKTQVQLALLRIDSIPSTTSEDEKKELIDKINGHLTEIYNREGESPEWLRLKGRLYQAQDQYVDAIQTYNRAAAMRAQLGMPPEDDMMYQLARVYIAAQQTGEARGILEDLVRRYEQYTPARIMLCRVLLAEGSRDQAVPHLKYLEEHAPEDPQVTALLLVSASTGQDASRNAVLLGKLPEGTRDEKLSKARAAFDAGQFADVQRLTTELLAAKPGDEEAAQLAIQTLVRQKKTDDARRAVDTALVANPESRSLKLIKAQMEGADEQAIQLTQENIDAIKDDFTREMANARFAGMQNKPGEVFDHLKKAETIKPDSPEVWDQFFQYYAAQKDWEKLQPYLDKLVAANQDKAGGLLYQFRLAMAKGETDRAVDLARQLTGKMPEFSESWLALAQGLQAAGKFDEAKDAYLRVIEKTPMRVDAYQGLVQVAYQMRRFDDAGRYIADARKRLPNNSLLLSLEIEYELNYGRPEKVIGVLEAQAAKRQDDPQAWLMLGRAYERILQRKASHNDQEARKWADKLHDHYGKAFDRWPDNPDFAGRYADVCVILNDRAQAEKVLLTYVDKSGGKPEASIMLADYYVRGGEVNHAELTLRQALDKNPKQMDLWQKLAAVQMSAGKPDEAIRTLKQAPNQDEVLMAELEILLNTGKVAEAKDLIKAVSASRGNDFGIINAQAYIALQEKDFKAARAFVEQSLALKPNNPIALHQRAIAKIQDEPHDLDGAIVDLKLAMQQAPSNAELRLTAADAYLKRRDRDGATRELETAVTIAPRNPQVWHHLMDLYLEASPPKLDEAKQLVETVRSAGAGDLELTLRAARVAQLRRDSGNAIAEMRKAIAMSNGNPQLVQQYMTMLVDMQQYEHLLKESDQLLQQAPDAWWVRHVRAVAKARLGAKDDALTEWQKATALADAAKDDNAQMAIMQGIATEVGVSQIMQSVQERAKEEPRWIMFAAWLYQSSHDWNNAVAMADRLISLQDKFSKTDKLRAYQVAGAVYLGAQPPRIEQAIGAYTHVLELDPDDLTTLNNLACIYLDSVSPPDPGKALQYSQHAYDLMRSRGITEPLLMDTQGWALVQSGKVLDGAVLLHEVVQKQPFLDARYHLAQAYLKQGMGDSAVRELNAANQMIADAAAKRQLVDPTMKKKIEDAMAVAVQKAKEQPNGATP